MAVGAAADGVADGTEVGAAAGDGADTEATVGTAPLHTTAMPTTTPTTVTQPAITPPTATRIPTAATRLRTTRRAPSRCTGIPKTVAAQTPRQLIRHQALSRARRADITEQRTKAGQRRLMRRGRMRNSEVT